MACVPAGIVEVVKVAVPVPSSVTRPTETSSSINVTSPVGVPPLVALTLVVKVTDCPAVEGLADEVKVMRGLMVGLVEVMVCASVFEVLARKRVSPL